MVLIQQYHDFKQNKCACFDECNCLNNRQEEIDYCLEQNINNVHIDKIYLLNKKEHNHSLFKSKKVHQININDRLKYSQAIEFANKNCKDNIIIIANNDIYFDDTLLILDHLDENEWIDKLIVLTRHERNKDNEILSQDKIPHYYSEHYGAFFKCKRIFSHDAWVFKSPLQSFSCDFCLGVLGCEGAFITQLKKNTNIKVQNGYPYIRAIHCHLSKLRTTSINKYSAEKISGILEDIYGKKISFKDDNFDYKSDDFFKKFKAYLLNEIEKYSLQVEIEKTNNMEELYTLAKKYKIDLRYLRLVFVKDFFTF